MIKREYWGNGQLMYETPYHEKKIHGITKGWYYKGQLMYEIPYHEGKRHGISKWWYHSNRHIRTVAEYNHGQLHGIVKDWSKDGQVFSKRCYLYNNEVTKEEYRRHELIVKLSGL